MSAKLENPAATRDGTGEPVGRPMTTAQNFDVDRAFATAIDHHRAGRLQKAAQLYAGILQARPTHPGTLHYLGMIAMQTGQPSGAIGLIEKALSLEPDNAEAHHNLGLALNSLGRFEDAVACFDRALALNPDFVEAYNNKGFALKDQGRPTDAVACFDRALALRPDFAEAFANKGNALKDQDRPDDAVACFDRALALRPDLAEAHYNKAVVLSEQGRLQEAMACYDQARTLKPGFAHAHLNLGVILGDLGRSEEAVACFERALAIKPHLAEAHLNLGSVLMDLGRREEAVACYNQALGHKPDCAEALYKLSRLQPADDTTRSRMEALLEDGRLDAQQRVNLHFALGETYDDLARFEKAFEHFRAGNELDRRGRPFDADAYGAHVDRLIEIYSSDLFATYQGHGSESELPVFIVGMPRSGTTLVEQTLASHPAVYGAGELGYLTQITDTMSDALSVATGYPDCVERLDAESVRTFGEAYLSPLRAQSGDGERATDKMPKNFLHLGLIALLLPKAKIIHCRRDPMDTCLSCYFQYFSAGLPYTRNLSDIGRYYRDHGRLMAHWRKVLPLPILTVGYEDMIADHAGTSRKIIEFVGLDWDDACLEFYKAERPVRTASNAQVRQPIYTSSLNRWRNYEPFLGPLKDTLGGP